MPRIPVVPTFRPAQAAEAVGFQPASSPPARAWRETVRDSPTDSSLPMANPMALRFSRPPQDLDLGSAVSLVLSIGVIPFLLSIPLEEIA